MCKGPCVMLCHQVVVTETNLHMCIRDSCSSAALIFPVTSVIFWIQVGWDGGLKFLIINLGALGEGAEISLSRKEVEEKAALQLITQRQLETGIREKSRRKLNRTNFEKWSKTWKLYSAHAPEPHILKSFLSVFSFFVKFYSYRTVYFMGRTFMTHYLKCIHSVTQRTTKGIWVSHYSQELIYDFLLMFISTRVFTYIYHHG